MYMYIYIFVHSHAHMRVHTYTHTHIHIYSFICIYNVNNTVHDYPDNTNQAYRCILSTTIKAFTSHKSKHAFNMFDVSSLVC